VPVEATPAAFPDDFVVDGFVVAVAGSGDGDDVGTGVDRTVGAGPCAPTVVCVGWVTVGFAGLVVAVVGRVVGGGSAPHTSVNDTNGVGVEPVPHAHASTSPSCTCVLPAPPSEYV